MPRDASGTYTLPSSVNPVVGGTTITTAWGNVTMQDLRDALTGSLSRTGLGGMSAPLKLSNGTIGAPAVTFTSEANSGLYRDSAGFFNFAIGGVDAWRASNSGSLVLFTVGVAAAIPSRLVIDGTVADAILRYNGVNNCEWRTNGSSTFFGTISNSDLIFESNSTPQVYLKSTGSMYFNQNTTANPGVANTTVGAAFEAAADGVTLCVSRNANTPFYLNRNSDGTLALLLRSGSGVGSIDVTTLGTTFNTASDFRLKNKIEQAEDAGKMLDLIEVVKHGWKREPTAWSDYGVIAQELHAIYPAAVTPGGDELGEDQLPIYPWSVDYSKLIPPMLKELQSLRRRVAQLEA